MMKTGEIIIYPINDGLSEVHLQAVDGTVWLTQDEIANLFDKGRSTVVEHIQNILNDQELEESLVCRNFRRTATDNKGYNVLHYNLDMILAIGFRVRSAQAVQFRKWANTVLKEYLVKGFAMDDNRLKKANKWDYFDEWLARIRDIRSSEKRFYQKIKDLYATAIDYDKTSDQAQLFFKKIQNKMLWAVTGQTAAELISSRSDPNASNMGLTSWTGSVVRKQDVGTAKNYLKGNEIEQLNRVVTMYLDYAEEQAQRRKTMTMGQWAEKLDAFLEFNERNILTHAGKIQMAVAQALVMERYEEFDAKRHQDEAKIADAQDMKEIEQLMEQLEKKDA
jgi:hypothetical protein